MTQDWRKRTLGQLARVKSGFSFKSSQWTGSGVPVVKIGNVKRGRLDMDGCSFVTEADARSSGFLLSDGDILIGLTGYVGEVAKVREPAALVLNQRVGKFFPNDGCDQDFLYFLVSNQEFRQRVKVASHGSAQANVSPSAIEALEVLVPPLPGQRAIAATLAALDDKMELNRLMNETLEAMARAIFKDWFVDFGPTHAKAAGGKPYLAPELWDLFPDVLDNEGKPVGWELSEIGKEVAAVGGTTPSKKEPSYWEGGENHWATPKDLSKLASPVLLDTDRKITDAAANKISSGLLPLGTVLLSSRAPIGYLAIAEVPTAVNQGFIAMVCEKRLPNVFVLFWCYENLDYIKGISGGSTFAEISKRTFRPVPVVVPSKQVLIAYESLIRPLYNRIVANTKESSLLAETRDLLLPKLISGEIRLTEAEKTSVEAP